MAAFTSITYNFMIGNASLLYFAASMSLMMRSVRFNISDTAGNRTALAEGEINSILAPRLLLDIMDNVWYSKRGRYVWICLNSQFMMDNKCERAGIVLRDVCYTETFLSFDCAYIFFNNG